MIGQFLAMVISNSNMIVGGQGYCVFEFTLQDKTAEYSAVDMVLRPRFNPDDTASGNTTLYDIPLQLEHVGRKRVKIGLETDCNVTGFDIQQASGTTNGVGVDLINSQELEIGNSDLPITINGN